MPQLKQKPSSRPAIPIAPMIDCVFLMLIYFMVTSSLEKQEADIRFQLPGLAEQSEPLDLPDEQIIELNAQGQPSVNEYPYDHPADRRYQELARMLSRFKQASDANRVESIVTIAPDDETPHQNIVKVMDAINWAQIKNVNFAISDH